MIMKTRATVIKYEDFDADITSFCILLFIIYYLLHIKKECHKLFNLSRLTWALETRVVVVEGKYDRG